MSASIDAKLADRYRRHFEMAAKVLKLEDEVDRQARKIHQLREDVEQGEKERERQRVEIVNLYQASSNIRGRLTEHHQKIQALASEASLSTAIAGSNAASIM